MFDIFCLGCIGDREVLLSHYLVNNYRDAESIADWLEGQKLEPVLVIKG